MNDPPPGPIAPTSGTTDPNETAIRGHAPSGSQPVVRPSTSEQQTVAGSRYPAGAQNFPSIAGYSVIQQVGEGGMGAVYLAEDAKLGRQVAIKTMKPELATSQTNRDRFVREARAAAAVEHENIVPIWGIGEASDGTPFIAMPFLQGEMLDDRLKRQPVAPLDLILKVAREVADGLAAAHAKGLIHRDIKPGNIWLEGEPAQQLRRCKILDFGLVRSVAASDAQITTSGAVLGTPAYMAPEQARGETVDHRADLFSLGVMLYRMATGKLPFNGPSAMAVLIALTTETPTPVRTLNPNLLPALAELIEQLMCKDAARRPTSASEVSASARQIAEDIQARKSPSEFSPVRVVALPNAADVSSSLPQMLPVLAGEATEPVPVPRPKRKPREKPKPGRGQLLARIAVGLLMLASVGAWLATRSAKPGPAVAEKKDENSPKELAKSDPVAARKKDEDPAKVEPPLDADRRAAEYVHSVSGAVRINGDDKELGGATKLPKEPFRLTGVSLRYNERITPSGLAAFKDCKNVTYLGLSGAKVTDAGLVHFAGCKNLTSLDLSLTSVSDTGLFAFKDCKKLADVYLQRTAITDATLAQLKKCPGLIVIYLDTTKITDEGLAHLHECKALRNLYLKGTKVTQTGIDAAKKALPACKIEWDKGIIPPTK